MNKVFASLDEACMMLGVCYSQVKDKGGSLVSLASKELGIDLSFIGEHRAWHTEYEEICKALVKVYGKPKRLIPEILNSKRDHTFASPREVKLFKSFMVKEGQRYTKTYQGEDVRRASKIKGVGKWEGFSFLIICRQEKHVAFQSFCAHRRGVDTILINSHIDCFLHSYNLLGRYGIDWRWLKKNGPELIHKTTPMTCDEYRHRYDKGTLTSYMEDYWGKHEKA